MYYFGLNSVNSEYVPRAMSPMKKISCKGRYPAGVTFTRCCGVPFSSPLGIVIQKKSRVAASNPQVSLILRFYDLFIESFRCGRQLFFLKICQFTFEYILFHQFVELYVVCHYALFQVKNIFGCFISICHIFQQRLCCHVDYSAMS